MSRNNHIAPTLPKALLDRIQDGGAPNRKRNAPTRKERRKSERKQKKSVKRPPKPDRSRSHLFRHDEPAESEDGETFSPEPAPQNPSKTAMNGDSKPVKSILKKTKKADPTPKQDAEPSPPPPARASRAVRDRLAQDDAEIAALEKKLGLKGKKTSKAFEEDGLDFLLGGLDEDSDGSSGKRKRSEDVEWLKQKRRKVGGGVSEAEEEDWPSEDDGVRFSEDGEGDEDEEDLDGFEDGDLDGDGGMNGQDDNDDLEDDDEDGLDGLDNGDDGEDFEGFDSDEDGAEEEVSAPRIRENPYVAPVAAGTATPASAPAGKYIPPSLRGAPASDVEAMKRLQRQVQGQLNRLSEANLLSILQAVEQIYQSNPRQYVTTTLIDLLLGLVCDKTSLMDTFLILHAGFVAALYKMIGTDFGAQVVERIVSDFDRHYAREGSNGKEANNLISLLAELYNFQVVGANIIFDYIRLFLQDLSEANTELLLKVVRTSGPQLRQDDPSALKDIVVLVQKSAASIGEANLSVRTKFMIETINSLKNNRMKTGAAASAIVSEHTTRMKKTIGTLNTRSIKASEPLRISLADIRDTEKKGKWWLVGASYHDPAKLATNTASDASLATNRSRTSAIDVPPASADDATADLLQLAREQRMNTDIRRAIFITIMSASDYTDAYHRLLKLNLKKTQELEIPKVLIHCTGAEASFNPYYTLIAKKLCGERKLRMAFQFGLWDIFRRMGEKRGEDEDEEDDEGDDALTTRKVVNLARMFASLMADGQFPITALKTLNFAYLQPKTRDFVEVLFTTLFVTCSKAQKSKWEHSLQEIIMKAQEVPDMVQGLRYFIETVVAKGAIANGKVEKKVVRKGCETAIEALSAPVNVSADNE